MTNQIIVITGAGSGLGRSLAKKFSDLGDHVCLLGRTKAKLEQTAESLEGPSSIYALDVASKSEVQKVFQAIYEEHGEVNGLINNAGVGYFDLAESLNESDTHEMIDINLKGTIFCTQEVLPYMKKQDEGIVANIISTAGLEGKENESVYCASKFGVKGFTESLLVELNDSAVKVFAVYMGGMKTPFWDGIHEPEDIKHLIDPDDIADIVIENMQSRKNLDVTEVVIKNS